MEASPFAGDVIYWNDVLDKDRYDELLFYLNKICSAIETLDIEEFDNVHSKL